ncbi:MAG: DUF2973 domain-containing protein [Cyanobacteriota bacterium]|jgi:hypothetical protein|nr:DUF2973 domain-containing protein [Cyanobacteriota bacterium]
MDALIAKVFPVVYGACFLILLWQAFRVMRRGFSALSQSGDRTGGDRTGRPTIHPELLDADGQITSENLLTVRFGEDGDRDEDRSTPAE